MRKKLIWVAPLAIIGMAVFIAIGGGSSLQFSAANGRTLAADDA